MNDTNPNSGEASEKDALLLSDPRLGDPDGGLVKRILWGISRHEAIAGAAANLLGDQSRLAIAQIVAPLGADTSLADLAGWADHIKRRKPDPVRDDPDTVAFLSDPRNRNQPNWHFVNLPLDAQAYDRNKLPHFTSDEDVVQITRESARVLRGDSNRFSKLNALRLITHLTGDLHQPVHVGCGFIDRNSKPAKLIRDPDAIVAGKLRSDRGGNNLLLPVGKNLHSYWDSTLGGKNAPEGFTDEKELKRLLIRKLTVMTRMEPELATFEGADALEMPAMWATSSLSLARQAYHSLIIVGPNAKEPNDFDVSWEGKAAYDARCAPIVRKQLTQAASSLATVLDSIFA
jgi:hypothetical protein